MSSVLWSVGGKKGKKEFSDACEDIAVLKKGFKETDIDSVEGKNEEETENS